MNILVGTSAYNAHVQHMVRALYEADALHSFVTGGVDSFRHPLARLVRRVAGWTIPGLNREMSRRSVAGVPAGRVHARWSWEAPRVAASRMGFAPRLEDWAWDRGERALDRYCASLLRHTDVEAYLGVEHGALASLRAAARVCKPGLVAFLSPHHKTRAAWVDVEFENDPRLSTEARSGIDKLTASRDARRDREASEATWIISGSSFTTQSLVNAGNPAAKILTVPLGGPDPIDVSLLPRRPSAILKFVYVGPVSVRKGAHYLLRAWNVAALSGAELHLYGKVLLPSPILDEARRGPGGDRIVVHGSIPSRELPAVYQEASALVLPTLCDGFGMVVSEALANGLPAITTRNAGAADAITPGRSGFVIAPGNMRAIVDALSWCADNRQALFDMRHSALADAARWTWADFRVRFRELVGTALGDGRLTGTTLRRERAAV
jgi:glycosyltransferase involved in cell wall biosynthesis